MLLCGVITIQLWCVELMHAHTIISSFNFAAGEVAPTETVETVDSTDSEKDCSPG